MSHTAKPHLDSHMLPVFARADVAFERGEGPWLIATNGDRYLDFTSGVAVNALGHAHPHLVAAIQEQAGKLWHVSNLFTIPEGERLATRLCDASFADVVFFCNSGAEAMEAAIKMARKFQAVNGKPERYRLITFEGAFHGRTLATLAAGGQQKYLEGFGPRVEGFDQVPLGDLEAVKKAIGPQTAGIIIEPWQGEGGVRAADPAFFRALRQLCDDNDLVLVFDEVQTGMGRTGTLFAHQRIGVAPDVMSLAKALGGGFPIGACLVTAEAAEGMGAGSHGSTFGGNPLAMRAGVETLRIMEEEKLLENAASVGAALKAGIEKELAGVPGFVEVRGQGLMLGIELDRPCGVLLNRAAEAGLLLSVTADRVIRLVPSLILSADEAAQIVAILCPLVKRFLSEAPAKS